MKTKLFECLGRNAFRLAQPQPMGMIGENSQSGTIRLTLARKPETNEWLVKVYINGKYSENATYYTNDKQDAIDTAKVMMQQYQTQGFKIEDKNKSMGMMDEAAASETKISSAERKNIHAAFQKLGLDGNGRFLKKEHGLQAVTNALSELGFTLDMVSADLIMGDKGSRNFLFRRSNDQRQDPFSEKNEIDNSRIVFNWEKLQGMQGQGGSSPFEILAYPS